MIEPRRHWIPTALATALMALVVLSSGCAPVDRADALSIPELAPTEPEKGRDETLSVTSVTARCEDLDGDGYGLGECLPDCDDHDPAVTDACVRCMRPSFGCACDEGSAPQPCDLTTDSALPGPDGVCHLGARTCRNGQWTHCEAFRSPFQYVSPTVSCNASCDPECRHFVECREATDALGGGTNLGLGALAPAVFCPSGTASGGVTGACLTLGAGPYIRGTSPAAWIDACAVSGHDTLLAGSDNGTAEVSIPFAFAYFGAPSTLVGISANGMLSFGPASAQWINQPTPYASIPNTVFAFWDDLLQRTGVCTATVGAAPNRKFVVQWNDATFYDNSATTHLVFEAVLSEGADTLDLLYRQMDGDGDRPSGLSATIGLQRADGTAYDQVTYNTANVVRAGTAIRWTPSGASTVCSPAVFTRTFTADCADTAAAAPVWGRFQYTSSAPPGTVIRFEARGAQDAAGLAAATPVRLPNAPSGTPGVPTSIDLGAQLFLVDPSLHLAHSRVLQITAWLDPSSDLARTPTLGALEQQYTCAPVEISYACQSSGACYVAPCRRGRLDCNQHPAGCVDDGPLAAGASCGTGLVCAPSGACVACAEGALCNTGNACTVGRISCATGAPVCAIAGALPPGAPCAASASTYTRATVSPGWLEACGAPGALTSLIGSDNGTATATLPFAFKFYGRAFTSVGFSANGVVGFPTASAQWLNGVLPSTAADSVFAFWDDLAQRDGVCTATFGATPNRLFVIEWNNAGFATASGPVGTLSFEVLLEESSSTITTRYNTLRGPTGYENNATGSSATIGLQREVSSSFDLVAYNTLGTLREGSAYRWTPSVTSACNNAGACQVCSGVEVCDGADNDCDGVIDESLPAISCGVGACLRTVVGCVAGAVGVCTPGAPIAEICNGLDDDCDGVIDDGCIGALTCPVDQTVAAGTGVSLTATAAGMISGITWTIVTAPSGGSTATTWAPTTRTALTEVFAPYIVGAYRLRVSGTDGLGGARSCEFNVNALAHGLRVELTWDGPGDVDLHVHNNVTTQPWTTSSDCHYRTTSTTWGARLDFDNTVSNGPENVRIDTPALSSNYTIAATNYARAAGRVATIKIYCNTSSTTPDAVFTSRPLVGGANGLCTNNDFWRVATVRFTSPIACTVTPINTYATSTSACAAF